MGSPIHGNTPEKVICPKDRHLFPIDFSLPSREISVPQNEQPRRGRVNLDLHLPRAVSQDPNSISGSSPFFRNARVRKRSGGPLKDRDLSELRTKGQ